MQIIIDIPDCTYNEQVKNGIEPYQFFENYVMTGTPIPKGHGRLIDADNIHFSCRYNGDCTANNCSGCSDRVLYIDDLCDEPTIIEADKPESKPMKPHNCMECKNSHITIQNGYYQCKLTGNCYIPIIMADKISEDCPLYNKGGEES